MSPNDGHSERIGLHRPSAALSFHGHADYLGRFPVLVGAGPRSGLRPRPAASVRHGAVQRQTARRIRKRHPRPRAAAPHSRNTAARTLKIVQGTIQVTCAEDRAWAWPVSWTQAHRRSRRRRRRTCASANARAGRMAGMERRTYGRFGSVPCCRPGMPGASEGSRRFAQEVSDGRVSGGAAAAARRPETKR